MTTTEEKTINDKKMIFFDTKITFFLCESGDICTLFSIWF